MVPMITTFHRREVLSGVAAIFGANLIAPIARAIEAGLDPGMGPRRRVFSDQRRTIVESLCERVIPTTDTPGARDAGVADFIEMMIGEYFTESEELAFLKDLSAVQQHSLREYQKPYAQADAEHQDAVLRLAEQRKLPGASDAFFSTLKQLTVTGYYTSEIGMTVEREFLPVPGSYDGAYVIPKNGKLFAY